MDVSKLKVGTKVVLGNGKVLTVVDVRPHTHQQYSVLVTFSNGMTRSFMPCGKHHYGTITNDIIGVKKGVSKKNPVHHSRSNDRQ